MMPWNGNKRNCSNFCITKLSTCFNGGGISLLLWSCFCCLEGVVVLEEAVTATAPDGVAPWEEFCCCCCGCCCCCCCWVSGCGCGLCCGLLSGVDCIVDPVSVKVFTDWASSAAPGGFSYSSSSGGGGSPGKCHCTVWSAKPLKY